MKLITFIHKQNTKLGALNRQSNQVIDLHGASEGAIAADMLSFLQQGDEAMTLAQTILNGNNRPTFSYALEKVRLAAPIPNPSKIMAIGRNYADHAKEQNRATPTSPVIFAKYPSAVIGPGDSIIWANDLTQQVDFEAELAVVIGKQTRNVNEEEALDYVAGYTICNDVSARDLQFHDRQYTRGKSLDTFCPLGPWLVTPDEIPNPQALNIKSTLNGAVMQNGNTRDMVFGVANLIAFISRAFTLFPGDVITTGTPAGVGVFRDPPVFMQNGDEIIIEIEKIGRLKNKCKVIG